MICVRLPGGLYLRESFFTFHSTIMQEETLPICGAVLYVRVSTQEQVLNGRSLENQRERLISYAHARGYAVLETIEEEGKSGQKSNRPGFQKVLKLVQDKKCDAVIVYSLSRFARNTVDTLEAVKLMKNNQVAFLSLTENLDTSSAIGEFFMTLTAAYAQLEAKTASERIRSVMAMKKSKGEHLGVVPYGFRADGAHLVKNSEEQLTIQKVLELRSAGWSLGGIAEYLTKHKYKHRAGDKWHKTQIARIVNSHSKK
jgi:site-specific DNA recombinase